MENNHNIGVINTIFNQNVESLLKTKNGKKIIKEYVNTIKNDKNLSLEYKIFDYIENEATSKEHVIESINILKNIDRKKIIESNNKLNNILTNNNILKKIDVINENLYKSIDEIIFDKKNVKYIDKKIKAIETIVEHIEKNKNVLKENISDKFELDNLSANIIIKNFNNKYIEDTKVT